jgi:hypothetical protein
MGIYWLFQMVLLFGYLAAAYHTAKRKPGTARQLLANHRNMCAGAAFIGLLLIWVSFAVDVLFIGGLIIAIGIWLPLVGHMAYHAFLRRHTAVDSALNYGSDPLHCGRCSYDLTGNLSGVCPECGWRVPVAPFIRGGAEESSWRDHQQFMYRYAWRQSLKRACIYSAVFSIVGLLNAVLSPDLVGFAVLFSAMCLFAAICAVRVALQNRDLQRLTEKRLTPDGTG